MHTSFAAYSDHSLTHTPEEIQDDLNRIVVEVSITEGTEWPVIVYMGENRLHLSEAAARKLEFELRSCLAGMEHDQEEQSA